ncbi:hypothetical protein Fmac_010092 [Flemingia macrophylla]|uniref:BAHD acyltransferase n=1 Tax=Flemingia macrophylla TaxID=520843 RepID=A0ABD1N2Z1_9FABA
MLELEVEETKWIKPSTPTPPHLKIFKLSLLDQLSPNIHGNMTLFYKNTNTVDDFHTKSQLLQTSLSHALTRFYPLAGRLHDAATVLCNDHGALFIQTRTNSPLSHILTTPNFHTLQHLLPTTSNAPILLLRFTSFRCGAAALTISLSHKIADIAAVVAFLQSWTASSTAPPPPPPLPKLSSGAALFPPRDVPGVSASVKTVSSEDFTSTRLVFDASKVRELKEKVKSALEAEGSAFVPSRVEAVLSLIWRCALSASEAPFKRSVMFQAVNLRPRMEAGAVDIGNMVWPLAVTAEEGQVEVHVLARRMRESMREFVETKAERLKEGGGYAVVMESLKERGEVCKEGGVVYKCSSWCKFPLLKVDFGWGDPLWMCSVNTIASNTIALMDTRDGGVEAFVTLDQHHMLLFLQHQDLLHYAFVNPTISL